MTAPFEDHVAAASAGEGAALATRRRTRGARTDPRPSVRASYFQIGLYTFAKRKHDVAGEPGDRTRARVRAPTGAVRFVLANAPYGTPQPTPVAQ